MRSDRVQLRGSKTSLALSIAYNTVADTQSPPKSPLRSYRIAERIGRADCPLGVLGALAACTGVPLCIPASERTAAGRTHTFIQKILNSSERNKGGSDSPSDACVKTYGVSQRCTQPALSARRPPARRSYGRRRQTVVESLLGGEPRRGAGRGRTWCSCRAPSMVAGDPAIESLMAETYTSINT